WSGPVARPRPTTASGWAGRTWRPGWASTTKPPPGSTAAKADDRLTRRSGGRGWTGPGRPATPRRCCAPWGNQRPVGSVRPRRRLEWRGWAILAEAPDHDQARVREKLARLVRDQPPGVRPDRLLAESRSALDRPPGRTPKGQSPVGPPPVFVDDAAAAGVRFV